MTLARAWPLTILLLTGCFSPKSLEEDTAASDSASIADVQQGLYTDGDIVELPGVVVTSGMNSSGEGFFAQDAGGGEYSGMYVYLYSYVEADIEPGDVINLKGFVTEYFDFTELTVDDTDGVEVVGAADVTIDDLGAVSDWEPWESALVGLTDQTVESEVNAYGEADLSGGITMDNLFYDFSTETGATYTRVVGTIAYNWETFKINPRSDDDLEGYTPGEGPEAVTVADIQGGDTAEGASVLLEDVIVTSPMNEDGDGFWVQDAGGGEYSGIYVYLYSGVKADVSVGDVVTLTGSYTEYYDLSELTVSSTANLTVTGSSTATTTELSEMPNDWEPYEGVLVSLLDVSATSDIDSYGEIALDMDIEMDNYFYDFSAENGDSWTSITGVISYGYKAWKIYPRSADDLLPQK
jgi:predicted extracellular nuclease